MKDDRPIFVLALRAENGTDGIRAIRALLKIAIRRFGLRLVSIKEQRPDDLAA